MKTTNIASREATFEKDVGDYASYIMRYKTLYANLTKSFLRCCGQRMLKVTFWGVRTDHNKCGSHSKGFIKFLKVYYVCFCPQCRKHDKHYVDEYRKLKNA